MYIQAIIIIILFAAAIFYIGRMMYKSIAAKKGCGGNCKCGVDFSGIDTGKTHK
ncbi:FeoB-associated Cys-rich membrane protein [Mucilaginibacter sp. SP1R1]|uniref:FeoB-associated Cys-rich membrane protein n=1 Tax=Mucilaginibacter sp. SP1R1 TaxID=2723091 RepID=UPI00162306CB|nr:FeoB-associated Cys-rich membrane protein [Mucilaginibacter sp. SP1R1]